jgi:hypothetical protein
MNSIREQKIKEALCWSSEIGCCHDKVVFAARVRELLDELGVPWQRIPDEVSAALRDLDGEEACEAPCATVNAYLESLLVHDGASDAKQCDAG